MAFFIKNIYNVYKNESYLFIHICLIYPFSHSITLLIAFFFSIIEVIITITQNWSWKIYFGIYFDNKEQIYG